MVDLPDFKYDFCEVIRAVWIRLENNLCHFIKSLIEKLISENHSVSPTFLRTTHYMLLTLTTNKLEFNVNSQTSSDSSQHSQEVPLAQPNLYVYKGGLKKHSIIRTLQFCDILVIISKLYVGRLTTWEVQVRRHNC